MIILAMASAETEARAGGDAVASPAENPVACKSMFSCVSCPSVLYEFHAHLAQGLLVGRASKGLGHSLGVIMYQASTWQSPRSPLFGKA